MSMALFGSSMYTALISCLLTLAFAKETKTSKHGSSPSNGATHVLPSSCRGLDDGMHYLKLMDDTATTEYPIVYAQCSNGYVMIDFSVDESWTDYFNTWLKYHYAVSGPSRNDHSNWAEWFLPNQVSLQYTSDPDHELTNAGFFVVSPDCSSCDSDQEYQINDEMSTYYMSALAFGCFNPTRGWPACDMDFETYTCKLCEWDDDGTQIASYSRPVTMTLEDVDDAGLKAGVCDFEIRSSTESVVQSFSKCAIKGNDNLNWKPSLGLDGRLCQCWKPEHSAIRSHVEVTTHQYNTKMVGEEFKGVTPHDKTAKQPSVHDVHQIFQEDFDQGTLRITQSGTYLVMEDIVVNFNPAPDDCESPNDYMQSYWWPTEDQQDDYPGAQQARDAYFLGFFAAITVEANDVVLDLQDHEIRMAHSYYYQQPYFSIIELESQPFLPQQGPGFFGSDPVFPERVTIKNGVLGLSSHHAIHGNWNNEITIENIVAKNFQTHGIQLNGFDGLTIRNVEVGPSVDVAYLNGNYAHMRLIMPTLKKVAEDSDSADETEIRFANRDEGVTMWQLMDRLVEEMDMVYEFAMHGTTFEDNELWEEAVTMFINPTGLPYGAVLYGLFLNYPSAGIFGWHVNNALSYNATIENVYVHDLRHKGIEVVGFQHGGRVFCNAFNGPLPARDVFGDNVWNVQHALKYDNAEGVDASYAGSIITDIHIAQFFWGKDDFDYWPGIPYLGKHDELLLWATGKNATYFDEARSVIDFSCNEDAMFHPSKGLVAVKASGVDGLFVKGLTVERVQDETPLGSDLCGYKGNGKYHFSQQSPYQVGFSMNMVMGLTVDFVTNTVFQDVVINKMTSDTGLVYGFAAWYQSEILVTGAMDVSELTAGYSIDDETFSYQSRPNKAPESCAIRLYDDDTYPLSITWDDKLDIGQSCFQGAVGCLGEDAYTGQELGFDEEASSCTNGHIFDMKPGSIYEMNNSEKSVFAKVMLFGGNKTVNVASILICATFVVMIMVLKMRFLWCPSAKKSSSDEVTPLMTAEE